MGRLDHDDWIGQGKKYDYLVTLWGYSKYVIIFNICLVCHILIKLGHNNLDRYNLLYSDSIFINISLIWKSVCR